MFHLQPKVTFDFKEQISISWNLLIFQVHFDYLEDAIESVKHGKVVGVLYITENFTASAEQRIDKGKDIDNEVLDFSEIKVWLDMSSKF